MTVLGPFLAVGFVAWMASAATAAPHEAGVDAYYRGAFTMAAKLSQPIVGQRNAKTERWPGWRDQIGSGVAHDPDVAGKEKRMAAVNAGNNICYWFGVSGKAYEFRVYPLDHKFEAEAGNFIFAKMNDANEWKPVYIGQSGNMAGQLVTHETLECVLRNGGTHIHAHANLAGDQARQSEEADLRKDFTTPCNNQ